ncbi:LysM peptidoglycan-binding domain-containing protein [Agromyces sp. MMS24-JH15]|uniref:LysM peptidoglycan-binding domain-containing protein n=1 Tax=Agromyces sp. MMS24-JH15 TaxID=3243765 RepID=UPI003748256B
MSSVVAIDFGRGFPSEADASRPQAASPARTRLRLTRRGRVVFTVAGALPLIALVFGLVLGAGPAAAGNGASSAREQFTIVTVGPDDTLWELASELAPTRDPRDVIIQILRLNGLESSVIEPGQQLALPNLD